MTSGRVTLADWGYVLAEEYGFSNYRPPKMYKRYIPTLLTKKPTLRLYTENDWHDITPLECFIFMGFDEQDFYKAKDIGMSDCQLFKQSGNSICVNVLEWIFGRMF